MNLKLSRIWDLLKLHSKVLFHISSYTRNMPFDMPPSCSLTIVCVFLLPQRTNINSPWSASSGTRWRRWSRSSPWFTSPGMWLAPSRSATGTPTRWSSKMSLCVRISVDICASVSDFTVSHCLLPSDTAWCSPSSTSRFCGSSWWLQGRRSVTRVAWRTSRPTTVTSVMWVPPAPASLLCPYSKFVCVV